MIEFVAIYYDGKTSARKQVRVRAYTGLIQIVGEALRLEVRLDRIEVDSPLAGAPRVLHLAGGAQLQTNDHAAVDALFPNAHPLEGWVHTLERRWPHALAGLAVIAALAGWGAIDGLPRLARLAAGLVPQEMEAQLGEQTLGSIDGSLCRPSTLDPGRQKALRQRFAALTTGLDDGYQYRLAMRNCSLGPNAFALPGGAVVLTDELARLAQNDEQISAVLAHEIGHVRHRHGVRAGLQAAGLAALAAALMGDAVSITGLAATLPAALLQSGYSRDFENEADDYAFQRLKEIGVSPKSFAEMMALLDRWQGTAGKPSGSAGYFSTHPATARRIERALANQ